ncbi:PQQ-binding-like beta-propeller repeat protein [Streptomyces sp. NPDC058637]|uniref:outer membrane protein assembly factor BamB family protein n=1 Tax=Streptomyces sp. NPDC058637 TaxID=3346569 RepID=UPI003647B2B1
MTQPPGQQPPQGGFGAPYDPPQGPPPAGPSYGYPPASPSYGYPPAQGAPQGPYTQQPGPYGQQQPGPYTQQPGHYGQRAPGPYAPQPGPQGHPPQAPYGAGSPPPGTGGSGSGRGPFGGRAGLVIGAVLAVLLVAGGGVWFATSGDGSDAKPVAGKGTGDPTGSGSGKDDGKDEKTAGPTAAELNAARKPGEAKVLWLRENGVDLPQYGEEAYGPWFAGDTVVKAMYRTVSGYAQSDGAEKWSLALPTDLCAAPSLPTDDGKIVVGVEDNVSEREADCSVLQMIDLRTGKAGWKKTVDRSDIQDGLSHVAMSVSGDTVTFGRTGNTDAFRVSDGTKLFGKRKDVCQPFAFTSGPRMIAAVSCQVEPADPVRQQVQEVDPVTGKPLWTYRVKDGWKITHVFSARPLVIAIQKDEQWAGVVLDEDGGYRSELVTGTENYAVRCGEDSVETGGTLDGCAGVTADADKLYLATLPKVTKESSTNKVVAFDLATGRTVWDVTGPEDQNVLPLRMEGDDVLIRVEPSYRKGGSFATLASSGGALRTLLRHPAAGAPTEATLFRARAAYVDGRAFVMASRISADDDAEEMAATALMVFGR